MANQTRRETVHLLAKWMKTREIYIAMLTRDQIAMSIVDELIKNLESLELHMEPEEFQVLQFLRRYKYE